MEADKPTNLKEYTKWLRRQGRRIPDERLENYYEMVVMKACRDFQESPFWRGFASQLPEWHDEYRAEKGFPLFTGEPVEPLLVTKPFKSFVEKTFRKNVLDNGRWPEPPEDGWILPENWLSRGNDLVRTFLVVRYLDGVDFLLTKASSLGSSQGLEVKSHYVAKEDGYYAAHLYLLREFEIPKVTFDTEILRMSVEIQITTQLQDVIRSLLHGHFEQRRIMTVETRGVMDGPKGRDWRWDYGSPEFATNYLGHVLHYIEGMIMGVRNIETEART